MSRPQPERPVVRCAMFAAVALIAAVAACSSKVDKTPTKPEEATRSAVASPDINSPRLVNGRRSTPTVVNGEQGYFEFQVEKPVLPLPGNPFPQYPAALRSTHIDGEVLAQFVVDTTGRVDMLTFKVLKSTDDLFTAAVKDVLPNTRFTPAEVGGRKVKQLVQAPFVFKAR